VRIVHLATQDVGGGGGGFDAAYRLHANLRGAGIDSAMLVYTKRSDDDDVIGISSGLTLVERLRSKIGARRARRARLRGGYSDYFRAESGFHLPVRRLTELLPFAPDALVLHWVGDFVTPAMMRRLSAVTGAPLYWYLMDMAPLTGGCHYAFDCERYRRACGCCPQIGSGAHEGDVSSRQLREKLRHFSRVPLTAVVPSTWLRRQAEQSAVFSGRPIALIPLAMDTEVFKPAEVAQARALLGLPADRRILFFGAQRLHEERKGFALLIESLGRLRELLGDDPPLRENVLVVTAGAAQDAGKLGIPFEHRHLGVLRTSLGLAAAYQSADVFINASTEDSGPMMINESVLCGTPVVAFDMGVAPDLVHTGVTGYRARLRDAGDLARGLRLLLEMEAPRARAMRAACREIGLRLCHPEVQVRAFRELIIADAPGRPGAPRPPDSGAREESRQPV
jgi:glycosyltransferase involved in cell wall biosynthesis